ncbi:hypothetical protein B0H34DRAFT_837809 [Crassisporium funariophilum]|nr:hypothetical protein B0H34DRAFT_834469 [Crassisporium funariophilum]KAF8163743.1 hypothetical protein B0H34DRAFT_837809 [Crassisporium funariophilum]
MQHRDRKLNITSENCQSHRITDDNMPYGRATAQENNKTSTAPTLSPNATKHPETHPKLSAEVTQGDPKPSSRNPAKAKAKAPKPTQARTRNTNSSIHPLINYHHNRQTQTSAHLIEMPKRVPHVDIEVERGRRASFTRMGNAGVGAVLLVEAVWYGWGMDRWMGFGSRWMADKMDARPRLTNDSRVGANVDAMGLDWMGGEMKMKITITITITKRCSVHEMK